MEITRHYVNRQTLVDVQQALLDRQQQLHDWTYRLFQNAYLDERCDKPSLWMRLKKIPAMGVDEAFHQWFVQFEGELPKIEQPNVPGFLKEKLEQEAQAFRDSMQKHQTFYAQIQLFLNKYPNDMMLEVNRYIATQIQRFIGTPERSGLLERVENTEQTEFDWQIPRLEGNPMPLRPLPIELKFK